LFDVALFFVVACTNLQWVATAAAAGASSLSIWVVGCLAMFIPLSITVTYLSARYPEEGGMYVWSKHAFGRFAGFITGWTYWCSNLPYFPALLYFTAGNALYIAGSGAHGLSGSPAYYIGVSLTGFALATIVNILGLDIGKWLNNAGAISRWFVTLVLIGLGIFAWWKFGSATPVTAATLRPGADLKDLIFWSVIAFAWTGPEAVPFMAGEIKEPRRTIPRGLALAAPAIAAIYILGTLSVLVAVRSSAVNPLYGVMQSIGAISGRMGWPALTTVCGVLVTLSCLGSVALWLGAVARIPFVAGIDHYLPEAFGRMHPRWNSPVAALVTQAVISALFILAGQGGTSVKGAYEVLVSSTVLITLVPFLLVFAAPLKLRAPLRVSLCAVVGLFTTGCALVLSLFPAQDETNKPLAVAKVLFLTAVMLGSGTLFYYWKTRALARSGEAAHGDIPESPEESSAASPGITSV
jgi:amino acid transporter